MIAQLALIGEDKQIATDHNGNVEQQLEYLLRQNEAARNNDRVMMVAYWTMYDGLRDALGADGWNKFVAWFKCKRIAHPKTLINRRMELQGRHKELRPCKAIQNYREQWSKHGKVI